MGRVGNVYVLKIELFSKTLLKVKSYLFAIIWSRTQFHARPAGVRTQLQTHPIPVSPSWRRTQLQAHPVAGSTRWRCTQLQAHLVVGAPTWCAPSCRCTQSQAAQAVGAPWCRRTQLKAHPSEAQPVVAATTWGAPCCRRTQLQARPVVDADNCIHAQLLCNPPLRSRAHSCTVHFPFKEMSEKTHTDPQTASSPWSTFVTLMWATLLLLYHTICTVRSVPVPSRKQTKQLIFF